MRQAFAQAPSLCLRYLSSCYYATFLHGPSLFVSPTIYELPEAESECKRHASVAWLLSSYQFCEATADLRLAEAHLSSQMARLINRRELRGGHLLYTTLDLPCLVWEDQLSQKLSAIAFGTC